MHLSVLVCARAHPELYVFLFLQMSIHIYPELWGAGGRAQVSTRHGQRAAGYGHMAAEGRRQSLHRVPGAAPGGRVARAVRGRCVHAACMLHLHVVCLLCARYVDDHLLRRKQARAHTHTQ